MVLFLAGTFALSIGAWEILQSKYFASLVSQQILSLVDRKIIDSVSVEWIGLQFFPPGVRIDGVEVKIDRDDAASLGGKAHIDEIELQFNLLNIFKNKIAFKNIILTGGHIVVDIDSKKSNGLKEQLENISQWREEVSKWINSFVLKDIEITINKDSFFSKDTRIYWEEKRAYLNSVLYSTDLSIVKTFHPFKIDEIRIEASMGESDINIKSLNIASQSNYINMKGSITSHLEYHGDIYTHFFTQESPVRDYLPAHSRGLVKSSFNIKGKGKDFYSKGTLELKDFKIPKNLDIPTAKASFEKKGKEIFITSLSIDGNHGKLKSKKKFKILNLTQKKFHPIVLNLNLESFRLDKFLYFKENVLNGLKVSLTGDIKCSSDFKILKISSNKMFAEKIFYSARERKILDYRNANLKDLDFKINLKNRNVSLKSEIHLKNTKAKVEGQIGKKVEISASFDRLNLQEVLSIEGLNFWGEGRGELKVIADSRDTLFKILLKTKKSKFLNYRFGEIDTEMDLFLKKNILKIRWANLKKKRSRYSVEGIIDFKKRTRLDLDTKIMRSSYKMLKDLLFPISNSLNFLPKDLNGILAGGAKIKGEINNLEIIGEFNGKQLDFQGEGIPSINANFVYGKNILSINNILIKKRNGKISGNYTFNTKNFMHQYDFQGKGIRIHDFESINPLLFALDGELSISGQGEGIGDNLNGEISFSLKKSSIMGESVPNSSGSISIKKGNLDIILSIFSNDIILKSNFFINDPRKHSKIKTHINTARIRELLSIFFPHNAEKHDIKGEVVGSSDITFLLNDLKNINANIKVDRVTYTSENINFNNNFRKSEIIIKNGKIKKNEILLEGKETQLSFKFINRRDGGIDLILLGQVGANIAKLMDKNILGLNGKLLGKSRMKIFKKIGETNLTFELRGEKINVVYSGVPAPFEDVNFLMVLKSNKVLLEEFSGKLGGGELNVSGHALLKVPFPVFNFKYGLDNSKMKFLKKTNVWLSSQGSIQGKEIPYLITGNLSLINGNILDEFEGLAVKKNKEYVAPYLPQKGNRGDFSLFNVDFKVTTIKPLLVKNSLGELKIRGRINLLGDFFSPRAEGRIEIVPGTGKLYFKSNDFILRKGAIEFDGNGDNRPFFDFTGYSKIQEYEISLKISGYPDNFDVELRSNPNLPEGEILSLLAIGVTTESRLGLSDSDQYSVTSLGIGTLIFNRFRINQELKSALGVDLSLSSEVVEGEKKSLNESGQADSRNSTKISVRKKITEDISIKASSTFGGDISQKKEMNINYNINENLSLEGVYELKDSEEEEGALDSLGTDIKLRIEF